MRSIDWNGENNSIMLIDQTKLPKDRVMLECRDVDALAEAIRSLRVRGAPALGVVSPRCREMQIPCYRIGVYEERRLYRFDAEPYILCMMAGCIASVKS